MKDLSNIYRPIKWEEISGQENVSLILKKQAISKSGLSNAYFFQGPSGVGKTTLARLFFKSLNCVDLDADGNPCGKCKGCENIKFDLSEINAANTNSVNDMRSLIASTRYSSMGTYKGILLDECHMLSKAAWNCLLKPIEDAPDRIVWIFCTTEKPRIPKTIDTRCQKHVLKSLSWTQIFERLRTIVDDTKMSISENELWVVARNSNNNLRQAIHLLEQFSVVGDIDKIIRDDAHYDFLQALKTMNLKTIWETFMIGVKESSDIDVFINQLKYELSTCLKFKLGLPVALPPSRLVKYKEVAEAMNEEQIIEMLNILLDIQAKISGIWDYSSLFLSGLCKFKKTFKN